MAKFFITNDKVLAVRIKNNIESSIFTLCAEIQEGNIYAFSCKKLCVNNNNFMHDTRGNFVIATGTYLYESGGLNCFLEVEEDDVKTVRSKMFGQYAVVTLKGTRLTVFCDAVGAYEVYYYNADGIFVISNDLYDMARVLSEKLTVNQNNILEMALQNAILCNETYFHEINRLDGVEVINVDVKSNIFKIDYTDVPLPRICDSEYEHIKEATALSLKNKARAFAEHFGSPDIFMTGGLDARLSLAAYLSIGQKPTLNYAKGNCFLTNTNDADYQIVILISKHYGLTLHKHDWSHPYLLNRDWPELMHKYGFDSLAYYGSKSVFHSFYSLDNVLNTFGYGGELYRNDDWVQDYSNEMFSIDYYLDYCYLNKSGVYDVNLLPGYRDHIKAKLLKICKRYHINPEQIPVRDYIYLDYEYRRTAHSVMLNVLNKYRYSNLLLLEYDTVRSIFMNSTYKSGSRYQIDLINELYSGVLEIPIFSHIQHRKLNRDTMTLEVLENSSTHSSARPRLSFIKSPVFRLAGRKILETLHMITPQIDTNVFVKDYDKHHRLSSNSLLKMPIDSRYQIMYIMLNEIIRDLTEKKYE